MRRIPTALMVAIASLGLALGSASAIAQKADTPKDTKEAPKKTDAKKADTKADAKKSDTKADAKKPDAKAGGATAASTLIDINTASAKELASLPGIGEARATAIVKNRPYKGKNELKDRKIIPESVYNGIQDKVIAKQDSASAAAPKKSEEKKK